MKRSYLNESLDLIDEINRMCPSEVWPKLNMLRDHVRAMVKKLHDGCVEYGEHIVSYPEQYGDCVTRVSLTEEEEHALMAVTREDLFNFLKEKGVGKISAVDGYYDIQESFKVGPMTVSLMPGTQLQRLRYDRKQSYEQLMTVEELEEITDEDGMYGGRIDCLIKYNDECLSGFGTESLDKIAKYLNDIGHCDEVFIYM